MHKTVILSVLWCMLMSCTIEKTDYEAEIDNAVTEYHEFKEVAAIDNGDYTISVEALNGTFYQGYNEIRLTITDKRTHKNALASSVTYLPVLTATNGDITSCPHQHDLTYKSDGDYYPGYSVFADESNPDKRWDLYIGFTVEGQSHLEKLPIIVREQTNKNLNMTTFTGNDDEQYFIALVSPQRPKVAENKLVAGIYKYNKPERPPGAFPDASQFSYTEVSGYTLPLDPRMPEPSMGNHSSPNNKDLTQEDDGLYHGVVNYTMTGNWTLNFIMMNGNGRIIKGTEVSTDFTPGVEGKKSELHINIFF